MQLIRSELAAAQTRLADATGDERAALEAIIYTLQWVIEDGPNNTPTTIAAWRAAQKPAKAVPDKPKPAAKPAAKKAAK